MTVSSLGALLLTAFGVGALGSDARAEPAPARAVRLRAIEVEGCEGLPFPPARRELWTSGDRAVDPGARFWILDRPADYRGLESHADYRLGSGTLHVHAKLSPDLAQEVVRLEIGRPIEAPYLETYLPGVALPCERRARYVVDRGEQHRVDLEPLAAFDRTLQQAAELLYDEQFDPARQRLESAMRLRPEDPAPHWMMARLVYLQLEARADEISSDARIEGYERASAHAERAVQLAPGEPEGYLWLGISRGRVLTAQGNLRTALGGLLGARGPRWLEQTLHRAVSLPETFRFFGDSTRTDALYALAQFYRMAPDAWYMSAVGTRGDIDRSIELLREVVQRQPERLEYQKELAVALLCRGTPADRDAARQHLEAALELPVITPIDAIDRAHVKRLLRGAPENVCGYSRDGFVEFTP